MSITVGLETLMNKSFDKFYNNIKFYEYPVDDGIKEEFFNLQETLISLSKETSTTEMEEQFEDGYVSGLEHGGEEAYETGYDAGYENGWELGQEEADAKAYGDGYAAAVAEFGIDMTGHK